MVLFFITLTIKLNLKKEVIMSKKMRKVGIVDYKQKSVPGDYKCDDCSVFGVRLWREYQTIASQTKLLCAHCAEKDQQNNHDPGWKSSFSSGNGDQIGWLIPAVPTEGSDTYWGYTSVPDDGVEWWKNLPIKKNKKMLSPETSKFQGF